MIRSAVLGGAAVSTTALATLQFPYNVAGLVETNGTVIYASLTGSDSSTGSDGGITITGPGDSGATTYTFGLFSITPGASQPTLVNHYSTIRIGVNPGVLYYNYDTGVHKADVTASGVGAGTQLSNNLAAQIAGDGHGSAYYIDYNNSGVYKL